MKKTEHVILEAIYIYIYTLSLNNKIKSKYKKIAKNLF